MKKKYEPPQCIDLGGKSRTVTGDDQVNGCFSGSSAGPNPEQCAAGGDGWTGTYCSTGARPGWGDCVSGTRVSWGYCEGGSSGYNDPGGCRTGMNVT